MSDECMEWSVRRIRSLADAAVAAGLRVQARADRVAPSGAGAQVLRDGLVGLAATVDALRREADAAVASEMSQAGGR